MREGKITALVCRLSREDDGFGDSESIQTQKAMLSDYARSRGFINAAYYVDDGYSGTNFSRPGFSRLMDDVIHGKVGVVVVKDLSRLGRDYLEVGALIERTFPEHGVRFISINDGIDSEKGIPEFAPFKNIMNEWYAKDVSKKVRSAFIAKRRRANTWGAMLRTAILRTQTISIT